MITLPFSDQTLLKAGYRLHKDGVLVGGYIRELNPRARWHAKYNGNTFLLHLDYTTKKGFHNSSPSPKLERKEYYRIKGFRVVPPVIQKAKAEAKMVSPKTLDVAAAQLRPTADFLKKWKIPFKRNIIKYLLRRRMAVIEDIHTTSRQLT